MSTIRKSEIGNVASASLQQHHYLQHGRRRPLAVRLHQLAEQLNVDLGDCDKFITSKIPPWETPNFGVNTSWLPSSKELEIHHLFGDTSKKRSKFVQVVTLLADAECCPDGPVEMVERSRTENTSHHSVSSSVSSDVDYDNSIDY
ncbi:hypothetical protein Pmani_012257 [Petrolisthes manimaculis]|uniref:Uncharacterized protein n=1 Tax=Petrolisthes manimaculis TaxID=1843537 RepID=A0AAE1Q163_9EUCA|nr:hypothetical protein Pmani_012257 [Petrolisthes manimaculis]